MRVKRKQRYGQLLDGRVRFDLYTLQLLLVLLHIGSQIANSTLLQKSSLRPSLYIIINLFFQILGGFQLLSLQHRKVNSSYTRV